MLIGRTMRTRHEIEVALDDLGGTVGDVARHLVVSDAGGARYLPGRCPISRYLNGRLPTGWTATVSAHVVRVYPWSPWARPVIIPLPDPVADFVLAFDGHAYPELERAA